MDAGGAILALNVVLGAGCGWPLAGHRAGILCRSGARRAAAARLPVGALPPEPGRAVGLFAGFTCLQAVSFFSIPVITGLADWPLLSREAGFRFGIPGVIPGPLGRIPGFCAAVAVVTVAVKLALTLTLLRAELHRAERPAEVVHS